MEMRMSDLWILIKPFHHSLYIQCSRSFSRRRWGLEEDNREVPVDYNRFGAGISIGLQLRLGPFGQKKEGLDIYD